MRELRVRLVNAVVTCETLLKDRLLKIVSEEDQKSKEPRDLAADALKRLSLELGLAKIQLQRLPPVFRWGKNGADVSQSFADIQKVVTDFIGTLKKPVDEKTLLDFRSKIETFAEEANLFISALPPSEGKFLELNPSTSQRLVVASIIMFVSAILCASIKGVSWCNISINNLTLGAGLLLGSGVLFIVWFYSQANFGVKVYTDSSQGSIVNYVVFGGLAFLVIGLLTAGVIRAQDGENGKGLSFLTSTQGARSLITYLITIGTIAIAIILTVASVVMETRGNNNEELKERLSKGKDILTILVGVLGTIVGFYYAKGEEELKPLPPIAVQQSAQAAVGQQKTPAQPQAAAVEVK